MVGGVSSQTIIQGQINKKDFYQQLKSFTNPNIPISMKLDINKDYRIVLEETRGSIDKFDGNFVYQIIDKNKTGYEKYPIKDVYFNLEKENITSDYQLYKYINKKISKIKLTRR